MIRGLMYMEKLNSYCLSILLGAILFISPAYAGQLSNCQKINNVNGAEDIVIDHQSKTAYLSNQDRRNLWNSPGAIYLINLEKKILKAKPMISNFKGVFHPHGIAFYQKDQKKYLYVVNHISEKQHSIESFLIYNNQLIHQNTFTHELLKDPNDLTITGKDEFYVTNFSQNNILHYQNKLWKIAYDHIPYANGILYDSNKQNIYSVSTLKNKIYLFHINSDKTLTKYDEKKTYMYGDNLSFDRHQNIWLSGHLSFPSFLAHHFTDRISSASGLIHYRNDFSQYELYRDLKLDQKTISSASIVAPYQNKLLLGTVYEPFILNCTYE